MEKSENTATERHLNPKKAELIELSKPMRELLKLGEVNTINEALKKYVYEPQGHTDLKTLHEWNKEGKRIKKGSKALLLWSSPLKGKARQEEEAKNNQADETEDKEYQFWNICYLFSNMQVEDKN